MALLPWRKNLHLRINQERLFKCMLSRREEGTMAAQYSLFSEYNVKVEEVQSENNAVALFALASIRGVGFGTVKALCDEFKGDLTQVFRCDEADLSAMLYDARTPNPSAVLREIKQNGKALVSEGRKSWAKYKAKGISLLFRNRPGYPDSLLDLPSPPSWLFVEGNAELLSSPFLVGFVGTRTPTPEGQFIARRAAAFLAQMNAVIVSGLAEGVDAVGHQAAILFGAPTIAVLGHGIDVVFPASTANTRREIVMFGGAVVSEYLPGDNYGRDKFVHRNRIQAALSKAVCFVEARDKSGTSHTLRFSKNLHRQLFGVVMGGFRGVPEEELIHTVVAQGGEVFDITDEDQAHALSEFVNRAFTEPVEIPPDDAPKMFRNIAREVKRLADEYRASPEDFEWLLKEIEGYAGKSQPLTEGITTKKRRRNRLIAD